MRNYFFLLVFILSITACKKEPVTKPVYFPSTTYETISTYDSTGKPANLEKDAVSNNLLTFISNTLPPKIDLRKSNPDLLTTKAIADIAVTKRSDIAITFLFQDASLRNALAFYTYPTNDPPTSPEDIKTITYLFPNVGFATPLKAGDKVKMGRFEPGTSVGFVLLQSAWNATTKKLDNKSVHFCSNDALNPETDPSLKKHAVLINYAPENRVLIGFEDLNRTDPACDHDFNDIMVYATVTPS